MDTQLLQVGSRASLMERPELLASLVHHLANQLQHALSAFEEAAAEARQLPADAPLREQLARGMALLDRGIDTAHRIQDVRRTMVGAAAPADGFPR